MSELEQRFWDRVLMIPFHECWEWDGARLSNGYGQFYLGKRGQRMFAHRFAYSLRWGDQAHGQVIRHQCDNPGCVRPDHLLIGTSLPWLLPRAFHDIETWNELLCDGRRGRAIAAIYEKIRRAGDFEHWAAFRESFERLALLIRYVGKGD